MRISLLPTVKWTGWETVSALSWEILPLISSTPIAAVSFLSISLLPTLSQGKGKGSILYSDRRSGQIPIENTSAWQLLDYLTLISLPPSIHSNHWLHFSIYFTINASGPTEQSSDESTAQSISLAPQVLVKSCMSLWANPHLRMHVQPKCISQNIFKALSHLRGIAATGGSQMITAERTLWAD